MDPILVLYRSHHHEQGRPHDLEQTDHDLSQSLTMPKQIGYDEFSLHFIASYQNQTVGAHLRADNVVLHDAAESHC